MGVSRALMVCAAVALGACRGSDGGAPNAGSNTPGAAPTASPDEVTTRPPPAGSVTLSALGVRLAQPGLGVLMSAATGVVRVGIRGSGTGSNAVEVCALHSVADDPATGAGCLPVGAGAPVDVALAGGARGVLVRAGEGLDAAGVSLDEVTFTYVPGDDSITVATPPLAPPPTPGECGGGPCQTSFRLTPTGRGTFVLDTDGRNGRAQLTLESGAAGERASSVLARVGGGGRLHVRSTLDGRTDAVLVVHNLGPGTLPPLALSLVWPARR